MTLSFKPGDTVRIAAGFSDIVPFEGQPTDFKMPVTGDVGVITRAFDNTDVITGEYLRWYDVYLFRINRVYGLYDRELEPTT